MWSAAAAARLEVRKSVFLAQSARVLSLAHAREAVAAAASSRPLATAQHRCWGFVGAAECGSSDDGEPSGTAGRPILEAIRRRRPAGGTVVLVARWKHGPNLGRGGLIRAYRDAALLALPELADGEEPGAAARGDAACVHVRLVVHAPADRAHEVFAALRDHGASGQLCGGDGSIAAAVPPTRAEALRQALQRLPSVSVSVSSADTSDSLRHDDV